MLSTFHSPAPMIDSNQVPWRGFVENPAAMESAFDEADASLSAVRLMGMDAGECGSCLSLKVALKYARAKPLACCQRISANAVAIELQCFGLEELSVSMQPGDSTVYCDITRDQAGNRVLRIAGPSIDLLVRCGFLRVNHILPYAAEVSAASA
jgi:hypothetical protein